MAPQNHRSKRTLSRGFTLVEILVVLVIVGILLAMALVATRGISAAQKRSLTASRIATVDAALLQFVVQNKRLPCPADGSIPTGGVGAGVANGGDTVACTASQAKGVVPWVTLGIGESDATDGWEKRLTYRVAATLTQGTAMDMSWCDPAGTNTTPILAAGSACNVACTSSSLGACTPPSVFLSGRGLQINSVVGAIQMNPAPPTSTGAAYIVISAGESGGGAYLNSGSVSTSTSTDGTEEQKNYAALALGAYYVDDSTTDVAGNSHFDDIVSRPAVLNVITKAALGPRSH